MKKLFSILFAVFSISNAEAAITKFIYSTDALQPGTTIYVSSGTVQSFTANSATIGNLSIAGTISSATITTLQAQTITAPNGVLNMPTFTSSSGTATTLNVTTLTPTGIVGTKTNDNALAGNYGEYTSSLTANSPNAPTTNQWGDLAAVFLSSGDWNVTAIAEGNTAGTTLVTDLEIGVSVTSGNSSTGLTIPSTQISINGSVPASNEIPLSIPLVRESLLSGTTVYLKYLSQYTGTVPKFVGFIEARRAR